MNVYFLIASLLESKGGPPRDVVSCATWLHQQYQYRVTILTSQEEGKKVHVPPEIRIEYLTKKPNSPLGWIEAAIRLKRIACRDDVFIVTGIWGALDGLILRLSRINRCRIYIRIIGMLEDYILNRNPLKKRLARALYVNRNLERAAALIVSSQQEEAQVRKLGFKAPVLQLPNGVNLSHFILPEKAKARADINIDRDQLVLLYLGRIHPKKGLYLLLEALHALAPKYPQLLLIVGGSFDDQEYEDKIKNFIEINRLARKVHFLGQLDDHSKLTAFAAADLFVLPSFSEGFSNAVLEAMASGLPVLITEGCNFPEVHSSGAGIVTRPDVQSIQQNLETLIASPTGLTEMGHVGREMIKKHFDWKALANQYHQLISEASPTPTLLPLQSAPQVLRRAPALKLPPRFSPHYKK